VEKKPVGLLELETAVLECFLEKTPLSPLGVNQNGFLLVWASCHECNKFSDFLKLFETIDMDGSFSTSHCM
jgi:hypothetical protein